MCPFITPLQPHTRALVNLLAIKNNAIIPPHLKLAFFLHFSRK